MHTSQSLTQSWGQTQKKCTHTEIQNVNVQCDSLQRKKMMKTTSNLGPHVVETKPRGQIYSINFIETLTNKQKIS